MYSAIWRWALAYPLNIRQSPKEIIFSGPNFWKKYSIYKCTCVQYHNFGCKFCVRNICATIFRQLQARTMHVYSLYKLRSMGKLIKNFCHFVQNENLTMKFSWIACTVHNNSNVHVQTFVVHPYMLVCVLLFCLRWLLELLTQSMPGKWQDANVSLLF